MISKALHRSSLQRLASVCRRWCSNPFVAPVRSIRSLSTSQDSLSAIQSFEIQRGFSSSASSSSDSITTTTTIQGPHGAYQEEYDFSLRDPEAFWGRVAQQITWHRQPTTILKHKQQQDPPCSSSPHHHQWYAGGLLNICYNCLDVQIEKYGRGGQDALLYDSPVTGVKERYTYRELLDQVATFAGALSDLGVTKGDRVIIYMPMIPQTVVAMLACARIGAIHSVVFGGFASQELATRISDSQPKVIVTSSAGVEPNRIVPYKPLLDKALELAQDHQVQNTIVVQRKNVLECNLGPRDLDYADLMQKSRPVDAVPVPSDHIQHIIYTSGTTKKPKGIVRHTAGWAAALQYSMSAFYDTNPEEVFWAASDVGWIVGTAYIVYAPLLHGCTSVLYEGKPVGTPDAGAFWRVVEEYRVKTLFVAPTAFRAIKQADPAAQLAANYNLSSLKTLFLAGEHSDPDTLQYCKKALAKYGQVAQAVDHWWQTELGWPGVGNAVGLGRKPVRPGACAGAVPGYDLRVLDDNGQELPSGELGTLVIKRPLPPGAISTLYNNDERCIQEYYARFPGFYDTSDAAYMDEDGYVHILGRRDDIINTAGHRLSTGAIEEILMEHEEVADCAVFAVNDKVKGQIPVGLVVTNKGSIIDAQQLKVELVQKVRECLGPVAAFKKVMAVRALPKTRSGKILRGTMSKIANSEEYTITPTIDDPTIFEYLEPQIRQLVEQD